jgi:hypothetical protein
VVSIVIFSCTASADVLTTESIARNIGNRVFENECGGKDENLVVWNPGETFLSIGIGHFIWYPKHGETAYVESFRDFIDFSKKRGKPIPGFLQHPCPWDNRAAFIASKGDLHRTQLEAFAKDTFSLQTEYLFHRLQQAVSRIQAHLPVAVKSDIQEKYKLLLQTVEGRYAMVDYVNFKGEGLCPGERIHGEGWGLKQVLMEMEKSTPNTAASAFARAAERVLERRGWLDTENPKTKQWLPGWRNRVRSYADPFPMQP